MSTKSAELLLLEANSCNQHKPKWPRKRSYNCGCLESLRFVVIGQSKNIFLRTLIRDLGGSISYGVNPRTDYVVIAERCEFDFTCDWGYLERRAIEKTKLYNIEIFSEKELLSFFKLEIIKFEKFCRFQPECYCRDYYEMFR